MLIWRQIFVKLHQIDIKKITFIYLSGGTYFYMRIKDWYLNDLKIYKIKNII